MKFDELTKEQQEKATLKHYDFNVDFGDWYEFIYENFIDEVAERGYFIKPDNIQFTGFWSQGDGASFTGYVHIEDWIRYHKAGNEFRKVLNSLRRGYGPEDAYLIRASGRYSHESSVYTSINMYDVENEDVEDQLDKIAEIIEEERKDLSIELYKRLRQEYEYLTSHEAIAESLRINDYDFDEYGDIV